MHCDRRISISARRVFGGDMSEKDRYTSICLQRYEPHDRDKKCTWYGRYASDSRYVEGLISVHIGSCRHTPIGCPYRSNGVHIVSISCQIMKISRHEAIWKAHDISTKISIYWAPYRYLGEYGSRIWGTLGLSPKQEATVVAAANYKSRLSWHCSPEWGFGRAKRLISWPRMRHYSLWR